MSTPRTDAAWDAFNRGACGMHYLAHQMRQLETELNAKNAEGSREGEKRSLGNDVREGQAPSREQAQEWTLIPPTEQAWYWHWNGDNDCGPIPTSVLFSGFTGKCFVSMGQLGLSEAIDCDQYGGWWKPMVEPIVPGTHKPHLLGWYQPAAVTAETELRECAKLRQEKGYAVEMWDRTIGELQKAGFAISDLRKANQELLARERKLVELMTQVNPSCHHFDHRKGEYHQFNEECPVVKKWLAALSTQSTREGTK